jgi:hypothetical protein
MQISYLRPRERDVNGEKKQIPMMSEISKHGCDELMWHFGISFVARNNDGYSF